MAGIDVNDTDNLVIRNTACSNAPGAEYSIDFGNAYGPIVNVTYAGDISTVTGADHPWANFEW